MHYVANKRQPVLIRYLRKYQKMAFSVAFILLAAMTFYNLNIHQTSKNILTLPSRVPAQTVSLLKQPASIKVEPKNPLAHKVLYHDTSREITKLPDILRAKNKIEEAAKIQSLADQPNTTWLTGPAEDDQAAIRDIENVERTSREAASQGTVPIYELYALPNRDSCANFSKGGFKTESEYLAWLERIILALHSDAIFSIEADSIAHTINQNCLSSQQITARYQLINKVVSRLQIAPHVIASYIDAGHSEWSPDPAVLVGPLRSAGIDKTRGVAVNVSNFIASPDIIAWSQKLSSLLGQDVGVIIDTGRNGKGAPAHNIIGESRWCNPVGRGSGHLPTTDVKATHIDAFFWGKNIGESDGACRGYPSAGTFVPELAIGLAQNATF